MIGNFKEGQLVAAVGKARLQLVYAEHLCAVPFTLHKSTFDANPDEGDPAWGTQGCITAKNGKASGCHFPVDALKPVVHYHGKLPRNFIHVGERANIRIAEDHYAGCGMVGGESVNTSRVLAHDEATGVFETRNTVYIPKEF